MIGRYLILVFTVVVVVVVVVLGGGGLAFDKSVHSKGLFRIIVLFLCTRTFNTRFSN